MCPAWLTAGAVFGGLVLVNGASQALRGRDLACCTVNTRPANFRPAKTRLAIHRELQLRPADKVPMLRQLLSPLNLSLFLSGLSENLPLAAQFISLPTANPARQKVALSTGAIASSRPGPCGHFDDTLTHDRVAAIAPHDTSICAHPILRDWTASHCTLCYYSRQFYGGKSSLSGAILLKCVAPTRQGRASCTFKENWTLQALHDLSRQASHVSFLSPFFFFKSFIVANASIV